MIISQSLTVDDLMASVPGARLVDAVPGDPADVWPTPFGTSPPSEWFTTLPDGFGAGSPNMVTPQGRVAAVAWPYNRCHNGYTNSGECWIPEPSPTENSLFHQGTVVTADGVSLPAGILGLGGHDDNPVSTVAEGTQFYNDPRKGGAVGRILETADAAFFVGALMPGVTHQQVQRIHAGALSGDWRIIPESPGQYDCLGPCLVVRPALPRFTAAAAGPDGWRLERFAVEDAGRITAGLAWVAVERSEVEAAVRVGEVITAAGRVTAAAASAAYHDSMECTCNRSAAGSISDGTENDDDAMQAVVERLNILETRVEALEEVDAELPEVAAV